jgi:hypothetical protein
VGSPGHIWIGYLFWHDNIIRCDPAGFLAGFAPSCQQLPSLAVSLPNGVLTLSQPLPANRGDRPHPALGILDGVEQLERRPGESKSVRHLRALRNGILGIGDAHLFIAEAQGIDDSGVYLRLVGRSVEPIQSFERRKQQVPVAGDARFVIHVNDSTSEHASRVGL